MQEHRGTGKLTARRQRRQRRAESLGDQFANVFQVELLLACLASFT